MKRKFIQNLDALDKTKKTGLGIIQAGNHKGKNYPCMPFLFASFKAVSQLGHRKAIAVFLSTG